MKLVKLGERIKTTTITMKTHSHMAVGVEIHFSIEPPFIEPSPIAGIATPPEDDETKISEHKHGIEGIPSFEISGDSIELKQFSIHLHVQGGVGFDIEGPYTFEVNFTPPPLP
jgi:hypothetical protein